MSDEISRYGGWYKHSNPNYEDFEMWNSVCEDAEPNWGYRNSQRAEREEREREARATNRKEQERREVEARKRRQREEQEREERDATRTAARKEAARKEQESKERKQKEKKEKEAQEEMKKKKKADIANAKQANDLLDTLNQLLAEIRHQKNVEKTRYEEEDAVLGAEEDRDWTSSYEKARSVDAARSRFQVLADAFGVKKTTSANYTDHADHRKSVNPDLAFELNHLEDILETMAESLRAEQTEEVRSKGHDQTLSAGWSLGCILM
ncbi:hypothetical protein M436DRAFT_65915 [Aureobasidium namibiae CBS 147.97]|uniref:Uncharacterized protein n=1 Tax=Aureobasidium namibiae CBS 147.97 TaxID=1043004 RepID=A0A074WDQ9_9PEZI